jgi:hypothetical protein
MRTNKVRECVFKAGGEDAYAEACQEIERSEAFFGELH